MSSRSLKIIGGKLATALAVVILLLWSLGPIYWSIVTSLTSPTELVSSTPHFWPSHVTLEHYARLFGSTSLSQGNEVQSVWPQFSAALVNSLITSVVATILTVVIAAFSAYAFVRLRFPGRD